MSGDLLGFVKCLFCGKPKSQVRVMIVSRELSAICDACIKDCVQLVEEYEKKNPKPEEKKDSSPQ